MFLKTIALFGKRFENNGIVHPQLIHFTKARLSLLSNSPFDRLTISLTAVNPYFA